MTYPERDNLIGRTGTLRTKDGWDVRVTILDAREVYGRLDVLVTDQEDELEHARWVNAERVRVQG